MDSDKHTQTNSSKNDNKTKKRYPVLMPFSAYLSSAFSSIPTYKGVIVSICIAMLIWMALQWDHRNNFKDTISTDKSQETARGFKSSFQNSIENVGALSQSIINQAKEGLSNIQSNNGYKLDMSSLIEHAAFSLKNFLSPHLKIEEQIPAKIFSGAKAVVFLTTIKGGGGISGVLGTGIIITRNGKHKWNGPCAIALAGAGIGLAIGIEKSDFIIVLKDDASIHAFESFGQLQVALDLSVAFGSKGRDISAIFSIGNKGYSTSISYSMAKGFYFGLSLEGRVITIRDDCNKQYYGQDIEAKKILDGSVKVPKDKHLDEIFQLLTNVSNSF